MLGMQSYRVIMKGVSPVVISGIAPSLDGILYEALSQVLATESSGIILTRLREILLFNEELGVFHASSLTFAITPEHGVNAKGRANQKKADPAPCVCGTVLRF
jgi:hypothetical protein